MTSGKLFASSSPVVRAALSRVVGQRVSVDLLLKDLAADMAKRPYDVARVAGGWTLRTRTAFAPAIRPDF
ncbi:MAG: SMC-Scp complex subunit ScpB [Rhodobacteraceae bacterium]|nr:SMC-Scp complex subunit ScpB [Paracoccaceae bacterium]